MIGSRTPASKSDYRLLTIVITIVLGLGLIAYILYGSIGLFVSAGQYETGIVVSKSRDTSRLSVDTLKVGYGNPYKSVDCKIPFALSSVGDKVYVLSNSTNRATCAESKSKSIAKLLFVGLIIFIVIFWSRLIKVMRKKK
jgi:hypothetical protein